VFLLSTVARAVTVALLIAGAAFPPRPAAGQGVNTALIKLSYRCGNWFRVRNANATSAAIQYSVYRTSETGSLTLPAAPTANGSPGYSETWLQTTNRGPVLVTYNGTRVAEKPNGGAACATTAAQGQWSDTLSWPIMPIHAALLPDGTVLTYGREFASENPPNYPIPVDPSFPRHDGIPYLWNPGTGQFTPVDAGRDFFCSGLALLENGNVIVMGGNATLDAHGQRYNYTYNWQSKTWTANAAMAKGRWYPTVTTLADNEVFVISGQDTNTAWDSIPEVYNPQTNSIRELTNIKSLVPYWAWTFVAPNGKLFYAGDRNFTYYIDPSGAGNTSGGLTTATAQAREYGSAVMYDAGKIIIIGGGDLDSMSQVSAQATAEVIDLNQPSPSWRQIASMHFPRRQMNAVLMANGQILASGGGAGVGFNPITPIQLTPEIWDPVTEAWTNVAPMKIPRLYHSETLLLPDGRVLSLGGGQPAATGLTDNFNAEIYSPPYLFNPDGTPTTASRPIITSAPSQVSYGSTFPVQVQNVAAGTAQVLWIRLGAVTHAINMNQRLNHLPSTQSGTTLTVTAPANANLAPPGHYLLFVLNGHQVPSVGTIVQIQ